jgi:hypothetical protein
MNNKTCFKLWFTIFSLVTLATSEAIVSITAQARPSKELKPIPSQGGSESFPKQPFSNNIPRPTQNRPVPSLKPSSPMPFQRPSASDSEAIHWKPQLGTPLHKPKPSISPGQAFKPPLRPNVINQTPGNHRPEWQHPHLIPSKPVSPAPKPPPSPFPLKPIPTVLKPTFPQPLKPITPPHRPWKPQPLKPVKPPHRPWKPHHHHHHHHHWNIVWANPTWVYPSWYNRDAGVFWNPTRIQIQAPECPDSDGASAGLEIGTSLASLPTNTETVTVNDTQYYLVCGAYLVPSGSGYRVIALPIGVQVARLPEEHIIVYDSSNTPYYYSKGTFFSRSNDGYIVVLPPSGIEVPYIPQGYTRISVHGQTYYSYAGITYQASLRDGKTVYIVSN